MAPPKGNRFWELRDHSKAKRPSKYKNPEDLWEECKKYFKYVDNNPMYETKAFVVKGEVVQEKIPKPIPYTLAGLRLFLGINTDTWNSWRKNRNDLMEVIEKAEQIIWQQKFAGAAADLFNANIISRELGLADKQDHTSSDGSVGTKVAVVLPAAPGSLDMDQWQDMYNQVMARRKSVHDLPQGAEIIEESPEQSEKADSEE